MVDAITHITKSEKSNLTYDETGSDADSGNMNVGEEDASNTHAQDSSHANATPPKNKGKARAIDVQMEEEEEEEEKKKSFPLMELPAEIRLEIYRACLVRPGKIMLSKKEKKTPAKEHSDSDEDEDEESDSDEEGPATATFKNTRRNRAALRRGATPMTLAAYVASLPATIASTVTTTLPFNYSGPTAPNNNNDTTPQPTQSRIPSEPLITNILLLSKQTYKEARDVLYSENIFDLDTNTAVTSLAALHQRSRRHIKHIELEIPTYTEILERFSEIVRLSLRYCTGLKKLVIHTPFTLPGSDGSIAASNTTVYANGFDILRWLPQPCEVVLMGCKNAEIEAVVERHAELARTQDKVRCSC